MGICLKMVPFLGPQMSLYKQKKGTILRHIPINVCNGDMDMTAALKRLRFLWHGPHEQAMQLLQWKWMVPPFPSHAWLQDCLHLVSPEISPMHIHLHRMTCHKGQLYLYGARGLKFELSIAHVVGCTRIIEVWLSVKDCSRRNDDWLS